MAEGKITNPVRITSYVLAGLVFGYLLQTAFIYLLISISFLRFLDGYLGWLFFSAWFPLLVGILVYWIKKGVFHSELLRYYFILMASVLFVVFLGLEKNTGCRGVPGCFGPLNDFYTIYGFELRFLSFHIALSTFVGLLLLEKILTEKRFKTTGVSFAVTYLGMLAAFIFLFILYPPFAVY